MCWPDMTSAYQHHSEFCNNYITRLCNYYIIKLYNDYVSKQQQQQQKQHQAVDNKQIYLLYFLNSETSTV